MVSVKTKLKQPKKIKKYDSCSSFSQKTPKNDQKTTKSTHKLSWGPQKTHFVPWSTVIMISGDVFIA